MQTPNLHAQRQAVNMQACPTAATGPLACMSCSSLPVQRHSTHVVSHSELCLYCTGGSSNTSVASRQPAAGDGTTAASGSGESPACCFPLPLPYAACCRGCAGVRSRGSSSLWLVGGALGWAEGAASSRGASAAAAAALGRRRRRRKWWRRAPPRRSEIERTTCIQMQK